MTKEGFGFLHKVQQHWLRQLDNVDFSKEIPFHLSSSPLFSNGDQYLLLMRQSQLCEYYGHHFLLTEDKLKLMKKIRQLTLVCDSEAMATTISVDPINTTIQGTTSTEAVFIDFRLDQFYNSSSIKFKDPYMVRVIDHTPSYVDNDFVCLMVKDTNKLFSYVVDHQDSTATRVIFDQTSNCILLVTMTKDKQTNNFVSSANIVISDKEEDCMKNIFKPYNRFPTIRSVPPKQKRHLAKLCPSLSSDSLTIE